MESLLQDVRYGMRMMRKNPAFTLVAMLTLALGMGANTAIFTVVNGVLLQPLPYAEPERLYAFRGNQSYPDMKDFREHSRLIEQIGLYTPWAQDLIGDGEPARVDGTMVNGAFFHALGVKALLGRVLGPEDDVAGTSGNVVISHALWQQQWSGDANAIGKPANFSGKLYTIVGVMPRGFRQPRFESDVWLPVAVLYPEGAGARGAHFFNAVVKVKPGVTLAQAQTEADAIGAQLAQQYPDENEGRTWPLLTLHERTVGRLRDPLLMLLGAAGLVLLVACANFANLLLARSAVRHQEVAVRAALGASRLRIVRQLLTESVLIALCGAAAGLLLANWGVDALLALGPADMPRLEAVHLDRNVLMFTFSVSLLTGIVFGLVPAWRAGRAGVHDTLKEGGRTVGGAHASSFFRSALVAGEIGMALVLLIGAGLLIRSFQNLMHVDMGFDPDRLITFRVNLPQARYNEIPRQTAFWRAFHERVQAVPGVEAAGTISELPLSGNQLTHNMVIEGQPPVARGQSPEIAARTVSPTYFPAMRMRSVRGRLLAASDSETSMPVAVVNESFVNQYFSNQDPIGKQVRWEFVEPPQWMTIVGVVGDVRHAGLDTPQEPTAYTPFAQNPQPWKRWAFVVIRPQASGQEQLLAGVKQALWSVDPQLPLGKVQSMEQVVGAAVAQRRFNMLLLGLFAALALSLAVVGIYSVMSYMVVQRTHEIGVRMALGAQRSDVLRLITSNGLKLVSAGVALGLIASFAASRVLTSLLFGITSTDISTYAGVAVLLAAVGLAASFIPARRASKVDPMAALRYE